MSEPTTTAAAGGIALLKFFGVPIAFSSISVALGFVLMWPKSLKEAIVRIVCTVLSSTVFGPMLMILLYAWKPDLFESARHVAVLNGLDPSFGLVVLSGPLMVMAGLPAWWVLGAAVLWLERRKGRDLGELVADARKIFPLK